MFRVTRSYEFAASHRLHTAKLDERENRAVYGKCNHPFGHGHNYVLEVSATGPIDPVTGRAADPEAIDRLVQERILACMDHRNLNEEVKPFAEIVPTSENLAVEICRRLKAGWKSAFPGDWPVLESVRIAETPRNIFEIRADEIE
jgi:6-pyruvoyltetrahydropterin/6-carboxytetrahydropterin synthase